MTFVDATLQTVDASWSILITGHLIMPNVCWNSNTVSPTPVMTKDERFSCNLLHDFIQDTFMIQIMDIPTLGHNNLDLLIKKH